MVRKKETESLKNSEKTIESEEETVDIEEGTNFSLNTGVGLNAENLPNAELNQAEFRKKILKKFKRAKIPKEGTYPRFSPDPAKGLSKEQVNERFKQFLFNDTNRKYSKSYASIFLGNICTIFNLLCVLCAVALLYSKASITQYFFIVIISVNTILGIIQEIRAKHQIDRLSILSSPTVKVIRDGKKQEVGIKDLVVDDIIWLETGNQIPADCIMIDGNVEVNEALLTGESIPIKKIENEVLYAGSFIAGGNCIVRVDKVGKSSYINKLTSKAKKYKKPNSEIMNSIKLFIRVIAILILPIAAGMFYVNYIKTGTILAEAIQKTCAVVIGMIPSGLMLLTSVALYTGVIRLGKSNTLVQDLYSLEMLARVNVLCLDKTGTITDGRMKVNDVTILNSYSDLPLNEIMGSMLSALGDNNQTSIALKEHFGETGSLREKAVIPFSSKRKFSAVSFDGAGTYAMGAPEFILKPMPIRVEKMVKEYAQRGLRVLVLAYSTSTIVGDRLPTVFRPVALISLADNIRQDAMATIKWFKENDVAVRVISGDNPITVSEVARRVGIDNAEKYISLEGMTNLEVATAANQYTVFGRVTPEQKAILIKAMKNGGNTVAMTGDGVNDILAMKEADCAISMASGSDAACNVSHLVLKDNNFMNMPKIVNEGRRAINNVKSSASLYIMKTLFTAILALVCICIGIPYFFKTNNMMLFEMVISAFPSVCFLLQPNVERVKGKFISYVLCHSFPAAITMVLAVMAIYMTSYFQFDGVFIPSYQALSVIALTFSGLVMLYRVCQPLNVFRVAVFALAAIICVAFISYPVLTELIYENFSQFKYSLSDILLVVCIIQAAFPLSNGLIHIFNIIDASLQAQEEKKLAQLKNT